MPRSKARVGEDRGDMITVRMYRKDWNFLAGALALDEEEWKSKHPEAEPAERADMVALDRRIIDRVGDEVRKHDKDRRFQPTKYERVFVSAYDREKGGKNEHVTEHTRGQMVRRDQPGGSPSMMALNRRGSVPKIHRGAAMPPPGTKLTTIFSGEHPNGRWSVGYFDKDGFHEVRGRNETDKEILDDLRQNIVKDYDKGRLGSAPGPNGGQPMIASDFFYAARGNPHAFAANHFHGTQHAAMFVDDMKRDGARVVVAGILDDEDRIREEGGPIADTLYVDVRSTRDRDATDRIMQRIRGEDPDELTEEAPGVWRLWWD